MLHLTRERTDVVVAAAFAVWAIGEVATHAVAGPPLRNAVTGLLATLPLVLRRRRPEVAGLLCALGVMVKTGMSGDMDGLAMLSAVFLASYSAGRHLPARRSIWVVGAMVAMVWAVLWRPTDTGVYDWVFAAIWIGAPGLAGGVFRDQLRRSAHAADRAARAELTSEVRAQEAVRAERDRIAREMHDTVAHAVSVMVLQTGAVRSRLPDHLARERTALAETEHTGRRAITDLHRLVGLLREDEEETVNPQPTLAGLVELVNQTRAFGIEVEQRTEGELDALDVATQVSTYRIVQEALTNVRKHASGVRQVGVRLRCLPSEVTVEVTDDGRRARDAATSKGYGLLGVRERVELYGGVLSAGPEASGGYRLAASLPRGAAS